MKKHIWAILITLLAATSVYAAVTYNNQNILEEKIPELENQSPKAPDMAVFRVYQKDYLAHVTGFGEATAHYELDLTAEVSGHVTYLSENLESGQYIQKGELLLRIDDTQYQQDLATAKAELAQARLEWLEEQRRGRQARLEWKQSGMQGQPDSTLVLREPQLTAAQAKLEQAKNSLATAKSNVQKTRVRAPFNGIVMVRQVQPGSFVQSGTRLTTIYSTDRVEVKLPLSQHEWQLLTDYGDNIAGLKKYSGSKNHSKSKPSKTNLPVLENANRSVALWSMDGQQYWQGEWIRVERHLDTQSRQRVLVVGVKQPLQQATPLYPGTFIRAEIKAKRFENIWRVPASSISPNGEVWLVGVDNTLKRYPVQKIFEREGYCYIKPVNQLTHAVLVLRPLNSYMVGMRVNPQERSL